MKANTLLLQLLLASVVAGFAVNASAAMYKWTDKQGNVHYTETPPPEGDSTEITPPPRVAAPLTNKSDNKNVPDEKNGSSPSPQSETQLSPEQQEAYRLNCEAAKGNLETYKTARRIKTPDGEIVVMDDEIRQQKMQQAQEQIKKFCK